jgi:asparagine synthase (glutamine-hydrolysing)
MCGIAGVFGAPDRDAVEAMTTALAHRGPDDRHVVTGEHFSLGATRLAIVDLDGGRQPVSNERKTIWAAHNGEFYNRRPLHTALRLAGHAIASDGDTALLPHLYEEYGAAMAERADGMFAFAVWDDERQVGLLARDRLGKKPLYYWQHGARLYFASEIKSLLALPQFERRLNVEALRHFLGYKHVPHPQTIFEGIKCVPPAHVLLFQPGSCARLTRYWTPDFTPLPTTASERELAEELDSLLRIAVARRLDADVPIGCFLSGGIDSSLTTAIAAELSDRRLKTFTLTYSPDSTTPQKDEDRRWARWVAERYGTEHHEEVVDEQRFPEELPRILSCFDEPFSGVVSTYFLSRLAASHVKAVVSGDGADELLGSYKSHRMAATMPADLVNADWRSTLLVFNDQETDALLTENVAAGSTAFSARNRMQRDFTGLTAGDSLNRVLEGELRSIFPDQVLAFVDRLSMAHGLEVRTPFLDTALVNFLARVPGDTKMRGGETKALLKRVAQRYFPGEMVFRPKEGFVMPIQRWFLNGLTPYVMDTLSPSRLAAHGLFDGAAVSRLVGEYYGGRHEHAQKILALVTFQEWHRLYRPCLPA